VLRLLTDADFKGQVTRGLLRRRPGLDLVRAQDVGLRQAADPVVLEHAARDGRVLLTHDENTMIGYAYERVRLGHPMPGLFVLAQDFPIGRAIEEIALLAECSEEGEWEGQVLHLPL
jgi:hypothetical protein